MVSKQHITLLRQGFKVWNLWRKLHPKFIPELKGADLKGFKLFKVDLSGADLSGADFSGTSLYQANLSGANLYKANLNTAILQEADLSGAILIEANLKDQKFPQTNLSEANLSKANLSGVKIYAHTNLSNTNFSSTNLSGADLSGLNLRSSNFTEANLCKANLNAANLCGANLSEANLSEANLEYTNLRKAQIQEAIIDEKWYLVWDIINNGAEGRDLQGLDLSMADLEGANLYEADLHNVNFTGTKLNRANLAKSNLVKANLSKADINMANLKFANLCEADLREADLRGAALWEADLREANLRGADLRDANLRGAALRGANLKYTKLHRTQIRKANINEKWYLVWDIVNNGAEGRDLSEADLSEADLSGTNFKNGNLSSTDLSRSILNGANFREANLRKANLSEVEGFDSITCDGASFSGASFHQTNIRSYSLQKFIQRGATFSEVDLSEANVAEIVLGGVVPGAGYHYSGTVDAPGIIKHPVAADLTPTRGNVNDSSSDSRASSQPRYLQVDVPERVRFRGKVDLLVRIALLPNDSSATAPLRPFDIPPEGIDVKITVQSPDFSIQPSTSQSLRVSPDKDSDPLLFELTALKEGVHKLEILAFNDGAYLGSLFVQITVDSLVQTGQAVRQFGFMLAREAIDGEATLTIKYTSDSKYRYVLRSKNIGQTDDIETGPLARPRSAAVQDFVGTLNAIATGAMQMSPQQARLLLKGKGMTLWKQLIPKELERTFWKNRDTIKQLRIVSSQDPIPWEVLYPQSDNGDDAGFLAEQFPVSRWRPGPPAYSALRVSTPLYVVPEGSPKQALGEVIELRKVLGSGQLIDKLDPLLAELQAPHFDVLHFACHNTFLAENPDSSFIKMGQYYFMPDQVVGIGKSLERSAPLVFMNACRTAGAAPAYTQLSGWADKFLDAGAAAFVGSLWEIRDKSAPIFAAALYEALMAGTTLGEAMLRARQSIQEETGDPTWLAYTLYGDPSATIAKGD